MKRTSIIVAGALAVAIIAAGVWQSAPRPAGAATGDTLRQFTAAVPACGVGTGIAFDGTKIYLSCWGSNVLERASPADGSSLGAITIAGMTDIRAMAYDASRGKIWACQGSSQVYQIDLVGLTGVSQFAVAGCTDGLAYDGTDDTLWASPDAFSTIYHYTITGTLIASFPIGSLLGGSGNSGIAVGGASLYLGNDGGSQIYQCDKGMAACTPLSAPTQRRVEDLECDNVTFAPKGAIWSQDAYDRILTAYEIPAGTCAFGGAEATPTPTATTEVRQTPVRLKTHTPTATPTEEPSSTPTPVTPTNTAAPPSATVAPTGGRGGVISAPDTGSGPVGGSSRSTWLFGAAMLAVAGGFVMAMGRAVRR